MTAAVAAAIRTVDGMQPVGNVRWLDDVVARSLSTRRFNLLLLGGFAVIAIALAAIGVYGLLTQLVAGRRAEIGLRMVLGAEPRGVVRLITRGMLSFVAVGILLGLGGAWLGSRAVARFVFGVSATDPMLYAGASALVLVLATTASLIPIRRAMRIDPITVLRSE
jgi:ABC-type antimicrobial peptide transport system permease subunit